MTRASAPTPVPTQEPKPANPEPLQQPIDPEKGRVKSPAPGKSEHAKAPTAQGARPSRTLQDLQRF